MQRAKNESGASMTYDLAIAGAGPAGLSAALDAAYLKLKAVVLEAGEPGGALSQVYPWKKVDSFLGLRGLTGREIADRIIGHARAEGAEIRERERVLDIRKAKAFVITTDRGKIEAQAAVLATGIRGLPRKLGVAGEDLEGVLYSLQDPGRLSGKTVVVVGGGDSAADCALGLRAAGADVTLVHRRGELRARDGAKKGLEKSGVRMLLNAEVDRILGKRSVEGVLLRKEGGTSEIGCGTVLVCAGSVPQEEWLRGMGIVMEGPLVKAGADCMTSVPGIFAAGDLVSRIKRIPQALATGETAAYSAYKFLKNPYWR